LTSTSTALSQTVNPATPTTTLTSSLNPSTYGQSVTLTATLSNGWATGTVTFKEGSTVLGTGTVSSPPVAPNSRGVNQPVMKTASVSLSSLSVGIHLLTAVYGGDVNDVGSSSAAASQLVNQAPSTTTVTTALNPSYYGQTVTVTVNVSPVEATGMVTFKDGAIALGNVALSGGSATLNIATLGTGVHTLTASYAGDGNDTSSVSAAWTETVNPAQTRMNFTSTSNPSTYGDAFTLVAAVSRGGAPGSPTGPTPSPLPPTGSVTFLDGQTVLGVGNISGGSASFSVQAMASGTHALSAVYSGDVNDVGSSGWLNQQVDYCTAITTASAVFTDSTGGPQTVTLSANPSVCVWSASTGAGWISLSANGGKGAGGLTATIAENLTGEVRTGTIVLGSQSIAVTQRATAQVFADVSPSAYYFDAVNMLFSKGISSGCGTNPLIYCPEQSIPRWQLAVMVVRAVFGGDKFTSSPSPYFSDVAPGDAGFRWIQKMYELGISSGCGGGNFCPAQTVTRDQMAIFATRMRYGAGAEFDFPITPYFTDVTPDTFGWSWIQRLRLDNVTGGCAATLYCPGGVVTRGDMAMIMIAGGFNGLLPAGTPVISSISPSSVYQGENSSFTITGVNTNFVQGVTALGQIPGIVIGAITVNSATSMTVEFTASIDAVLQPVSVVAITGNPPGNEEAVLPNGVVIYGAP
jgi:hypothetical protein